MVRFVLLAIADAGGPAMVPNTNTAEAVFDQYWGPFVEEHLKRRPGAWPHEWKCVVHVAKQHGAGAVALARKNKNPGPVTMDEFYEAGCDAASYCLTRFPQVQTLGCWCNSCVVPAESDTTS